VNFFLNMLRRLGVPLVSQLQGHASPLARQKRPSLLHPVKGGPCRRCHTRGTDVGKEKSVYWMRVNRQLLAALYWEACTVRRLSDGQHASNQTTRCIRRASVHAIAYKRGLHAIHKSHEVSSCATLPHKIIFRLVGADDLHGVTNLYSCVEQCTCLMVK
jgi:hypothetical protein